jgi:hypothetical protein
MADMVAEKHQGCQQREDKARACIDSAKSFAAFSQLGVGGVKMTKKQYQAPVLRKVGKLSAVVAGVSKAV